MKGYFKQNQQRSFDIMSAAKKKVTVKKKTTKKKKVLVFGGKEKCAHDYKACCPILKRYLKTFDNLDVDVVMNDYDAFLAENMKPYSLLVSYNTGGQLSIEQKRGLVEWVASGKGFIGIHGAADSFKDSPEYLAMIGGVFRGHPFTRKYMVSVNENHPITKNLKGYVVKYWEKWPVYEYIVNDEQYLLDYDPRVNVLASTVFRGKHWPVAWVKPWGKGKVFYMALGHNPAACKNLLFKEMFLGGVKWALNRRPDPEVPTDKYAIS